MDVNGSTVKALRQARGWTQQHLADACDVSLRTIQRVEKTDSASHETVLGLCAVLEVDRADLSVIPDARAGFLAPVELGHVRLYVLLAGLGGFGLGVGAMMFYMGAL